MSSAQAPRLDAPVEEAGESSCPACRGGVEPAFVVSGYRIVRCRRCATLVVLDADEAAEYYLSERYFQNPDFAVRGVGLCGYKDYLADREHIELKFDQILSRLERLLPPGRLLDVGAGPGFLVSVGRSRGWDARGVDPNPWAAKYASEEVGVHVDVGSLEREEPASFDAITMLDVLEHVSDPEALVARASEALRLGGVLVVLTPDAGSPVSRGLGRRWPEIQRVPEHLVLFSTDGLVEVLGRHDLHVVGAHSVGKTSSLGTLAADVRPIVPALGKVLARLGRTRLGQLELTLDAGTKICMYAVKGPDEAAAAAVHADLHQLAGARRLADWMFSVFERDVQGIVAEIGSGVGTFTSRLLAAGADRVVAIEPDERCVADLHSRFRSDPRVEIVAEEFPTSQVQSGTFDFVLCQNVLEHIEEDTRALGAMAELLRPGGVLGLLVPAEPRLYGRLDREYGHVRRYTRAGLRAAVEAAGLEVEELRPFNALAVPGWLAANRRSSGRIGTLLLRAFDAVLPVWRPLEDAIRPRFGLSLMLRARRPS